MCFSISRALAHSACPKSLRGHLSLRGSPHSCHLEPLYGCELPGVVSLCTRNWYTHNQQCLTDRALGNCRAAESIPVVWKLVAYSNWRCYTCEVGFKFFSLAINILQLLSFRRLTLVHSLMSRWGLITFPNLFLFFTANYEALRGVYRVLVSRSRNDLVQSSYKYRAFNQRQHFLAAWRWVPLVVQNPSIYN